MKVNCFSATFWFNIFTEHSEILKDFNSELKDEYKNFTIANNDENSNLLAPIIMASNSEKKTNLVFSKINLQYSVEDSSFDNFSDFKEMTLKIFEILDTNNVEVLHSSLFINSEEYVDNALSKIIEKTLNKSLVTSDLVDTNLKLAKKCDDQFYKFVSISNKKQIKFPKKVDNLGRFVPIPLIPWHEALEEKDILEVTFELNDKCSFDFIKNYHTTEFHINKMLYILENEFESDITNIIEKGEF